eukprot:551109-Alexandrium_andersonii.AAC.1
MCGYTQRLCLSTPLALEVPSVTSQAAQANARPTPPQPEAPGKRRPPTAPSGPPLREDRVQLPFKVAL